MNYFVILLPLQFGSYYFWPQGSLIITFDTLSILLIRNTRFYHNILKISQHLFQFSPKCILFKKMRYVKRTRYKECLSEVFSIMLLSQLYCPWLIKTVYNTLTTKSNILAWLYERYIYGTQNFYYEVFKKFNEDFN